MKEVTYAVINPTTSEPGFSITDEYNHALSLAKDSPDSRIVEIEKFGEGFIMTHHSAEGDKLRIEFSASISLFRLSFHMKALLKELHHANR